MLLSLFLLGGLPQRALMLTEAETRCVRFSCCCRVHSRFGPWYVIIRGTTREIQDYRGPFTTTATTTTGLISSGGVARCCRTISIPELVGAVASISLVVIVIDNGDVGVGLDTGADSLVDLKPCPTSAFQLSLAPFRYRCCHVAQHWDVRTLRARSRNVKTRTRHPSWM